MSTTRHEGAGAVRVAVLSGGMSLEREVSLRSGMRVATALEEQGLDVRRIDVDADLVRTLEEGAFDIALLALHGAAGEDGTIQSLLDLLHLPFTGSGVLASSLAWNKPIAQGIYERAGLAVPARVTLSQQAFRELGASAVVDRVATLLGVPLVVKPATGGSSLGLTVVTAATALPAAIVGAFSYADTVLIERFIAGTEVAVTVLDGRALPPVEISPKDGRYDFAARYTAGATEFHAPARLDVDVLHACEAMAIAAGAAIGARHIWRADMIVDEAGRPWLLEIDTCPGMTETSLAPLAAEAAGMDFPTLCRTLVELAAPGAGTRAGGGA
jgi:D-alanine-D-alanine ligase